MTVVLAVDLGKTGCRTALLDGDVLLGAAEGVGAPGLAEPQGLSAAADAVLAALPTGLPGAGLVVGVGAAGASAAPDAARRLAGRLCQTLHAAAVAVTTDAVTAHAGALRGEPGVVVAAGTGAVAVGVGRNGTVRLVDGWGQWLGDDGGGSWVGRQGLRAVTRELDGRGPATALTALAAARFGDLHALPATLVASGNVARATASFAPDVLTAADAGDREAQRVLGEAGAALAESARVAATATGSCRVTLVGGLRHWGEPLLRAWRDALGGELEVAQPAGTALDGAALIAVRGDLPHESHVHRHIPPSPRSSGGPVTHQAVPRGGADVDTLATEQVRGGLEDLDRWPARQLVDVLLDAEAAVPAALRAVADPLTAAVELAAGALAAGGRLVYVGAGTPGRLAALDAAECPPTFGVSPDVVVAVLAGGDDAAAMAIEGAEDDAEAGAADVRALGLRPADLVVGITASGRTPYVLGALDAAGAAGCRTVAVANNSGTAAGARADVAVEVLTGAEVIAGSTRLTAGTSQKIVLNVLSTSAMVRTGRTYGAWMVDVQATNEKLRRRARRIVREVTGADDETAGRTLEAAGWHSATAIAALLAGVAVPEARAALDAAGGRVREALDALGVGTPS